MKVAWAGAFAAARVGFCVATGGFSALVRVDSVRSFLVFLEIAGAVFAVITWTTSVVVSSLRLSPPNVDGTSPCARAPALKVTETNAVASAKKIGRLRTSARYAGNRNPWQAFFFDKNRWRLVSYRGRDFDVRATMPPRFNSRGNNRAQIRVEDRTFGRDQCTLDSDGGAPIHRRLGR